MASKTPISLELAALGFFFRERFLTDTLVVNNNWTLVGNPTLNNGLVLDGSTQYGRIELPEAFSSSSITIVIRFTPDFAHDDGTAHYVFDVNPTGDYYVEKTAADALDLYLGNTSIVSIAAANYGTYWHQNQQNILIVTGTTGDTSIWLNGFEITSSDATAWTPTYPSQFTIGGTHAGGSLFDGTIHEILFGDLLLDDSSCQQLSKDYLSQNVPDLKSLLEIPMLDTAINGDGATYTHIRGTTTQTECLLGSDGLTAAEMPTLLHPRGFSFDGGDFMTIADSDEFTFSNASGDLPFTVCIYFNPGSASALAGVIGKYDSVSDGEWVIYMVPGTSKIGFFFTDQSVSAYFSQNVDSDLVTGTAETWVFVYDGSGSGAGITVYRNGLVAATSAGAGAGVYGQIRNSANPLLIGKYSTNILPSGSEIYTVEIYPYELTAYQAKLWHNKAITRYKGSLTNRLSDFYSVLTLPMNEVKVNSSEETYTPITGTTTETEALLGSDGTTTSEFPTLLPGGGFSFDGGDFIKVADSDEFTFSDGSGDLPFSICFRYKPGNAATTATIIAKYSGASDGEWTVYHVGSLLYFFITDQSVSKYMYQRTNLALVTGTTETWTCTYDASAATTGMIIYRNGILAAQTAVTVGPYTQMRNTNNSLNIGSNSAEGSILPAGSELYDVQIFNYELNATEALLWHERAVNKYSGSIISETTEKKSVLSLPLTEVRVNGSGESYTPITGSSTNKEALLGSDGTTVAEMPTLLSKGGFSFDGGDLITVADSDEFTFSDDNGDLPFSVCVYYKSGDPSVLGGIVSKYAGSQREWIIFQSGNTIYFYVYDEVNNKSIQCPVDADLVTNLPETWVFTYSGVVASSSLVSYRNGLLAASTNVLQAGYIKMTNNTTSVQIGSYDSQDLPSGSEIYLVEIFPYELSASQAAAWHKKAVSLKRGMY
jgi:hypothetical protein